MIFPISAKGPLFGRPGQIYSTAGILSHGPHRGDSRNLSAEWRGCRAVFADFSRGQTPPFIRRRRRRRRRKARLSCLRPWGVTNARKEGKNSNIKKISIAGYISVVTSHPNESRDCAGSAAPPNDPLLSHYSVFCDMKRMMKIKCGRMYQA